MFVFLEYLFFLLFRPNTSLKTIPKKGNHWNLLHTWKKYRKKFYLFIFTHDALGKHHLFKANVDGNSNFKKPMIKLTFLTLYTIPIIWTCTIKLPCIDILTYTTMKTWIRIAWHYGWNKERKQNHVNHDIYSTGWGLYAYLMCMFRFFMDCFLLYIEAHCPHSLIPNFEQNCSSDFYSQKSKSKCVYYYAVLCELWVWESHIYGK